MNKMRIPLLISLGVNLIASINTFASPSNTIKIHYTTTQVDCNSLHDANKFTQQEIQNASDFLHEAIGNSALTGFTFICPGFSSCPEFESKASKILAESRQWIKDTKSLAVPKETIPIKETIMAQIESEHLFRESTLKYYQTNDINIFKNTKFLVDIKNCATLVDKLAIEKDKKTKDNLLFFELPNCMNPYASIPEEDIDKVWKKITLSESCESQLDVSE